MKAIILLFPLFLCLKTLSQQKYEVGLEGGISQDEYTIDDPGNVISIVPALNGFIGVNFRVNKKNNSFYEFGVSTKGYTAPFTLPQQFSQTAKPLGSILFLPLRLGYNHSITDRFSIVPQIGLTPCFKFPHASYEPFYNEKSLNNKFYITVAPRLGMERKSLWLPGLKYSFYVNYYYQWLKTITVFDVKYRANNGSDQSSTVTGKGRFWNFSVGLKYMFHEFKE